ncbi:MAG: HAMP domain-containing histidine kinase [Bacteroidia bacterium]|nr:HAMP domain-containing histidine kinase [Bacteroidia bacterium]
MKFTNKPTRIKVGLLFIFLSTSISVVFSQRNVPLSNPGNKAALEVHDSRAQSFVAKNLNRFGLDKLSDYNKTLDSSFSSELKDTLELMEKTYLMNSSSLQTNLQQQKNKIQELTEQKSELSTKKNKLLRTAAFTIGVWLILVIIFIQFKKRKIRKKDIEVEITTAQLKNTKQNATIARATIDKVRQLKNTITKFSEDTEQLNSLSAEINNSSVPDSKWTNEISASIQKISASAAMELRLANSLINQEGELSDEKVSIDINKLCEEYLNIASRGVLSEGNEFNCQITSDFEKNLPTVKVNQAAIGSLLLNVLNNSFRSVEEKFNNGVKGYQPKVTISTRILPRFLQIRIKDNGLGMSNTVLPNATTQFFTTLENGKGAGLGLSESMKIMTELHKGELKIESENGNSTDVYIKFFL